jgi:hypothetical protein
MKLQIRRLRSDSWESGKRTELRKGSNQSKTVEKITKKINYKDEYRDRLQILIASLDYVITTGRKNT